MCEKNKDKFMKIAKNFINDGALCCKKDRSKCVAFGFNPVVKSDDIFKTIKAEDILQLQKMLISLNTKIHKISDATANLIKKAKNFATKMDSNTSPLVQSDIDASVWSNGCKFDKMPNNDIL